MFFALFVVIITVFGLECDLSKIQFDQNGALTVKARVKKQKKKVLQHNCLILLQNIFGNNINIPHLFLII